MEHYRRALGPLVVGKPIAGGSVEREKSINVAVPEFVRTLQGNRIERIDRLAKHLLFQLASGHALHLHLMLGGSMFYGTPEQKRDRSAQVTLQFTDGRQLYFHGLRLGYLHLVSQDEVGGIAAKLGPDPFDPRLTRERFRSLLRSKRGTLKVTLVDQSIVSGIGNCYSDEICFAARLLPTRRTSGLGEAETNALFAAMRSVLDEATRGGGYMDMPLYEGDVQTGAFDPRCAVYDREDEPCVRCGAPIRFAEVSSRKCFFCEGCQR